MTLLAILAQRDQLDHLFDLVERFQRGQYGHGPPAVVLAISGRMTEYLCVRVAGFFEKSIQQIFYEHALRTGRLQLARFVSKELEWETSYNTQRLLDVVGRFDTDWQRQLEIFMADDNRKNALDSIRNDRNRIAHGESVTVGLSTLKEWYKRVTDTVDYVESIVL